MNIASMLRTILARISRRRSFACSVWKIRQIFSELLSRVPTLSSGVALICLYLVISSWRVRIMCTTCRMLIEVKKTVERRSVFQAMSELIALELMATDPVVALLTDFGSFGSPERRTVPLS
ncbi:hypothetical protein F441_19805 [Phytophthora nicotianae CJ01A1]|uniref:Uncharacterized protein n=1 Tax=Phytophthora nicotianae CJ01A1 TaxID=1317063 RepID=W2VY36_PHYNI|nr:hypothetical protein F441_19805 [Phytophthora nicotianae CJ01A1]